MDDTGEPDGEHDDGMTLDRFPPYLLNRIVNRLNLDLAEALRPLNITPARWRMLAVLAAHDGRRMGELSVYCVLDLSTTSRLVDQMERDGLAERRPGASDHRIVEVFITDRGRAAFRQVFPVAREQSSKALEGFSDAEFETLLAYLQRILENVRRTAYT